MAINGSSFARALANTKTEIEIYICICMYLSVCAVHSSGFLVILIYFMNLLILFNIEFYEYFSIIVILPSLRWFGVLTKRKRNVYYAPCKICMRKNHTPK